MIRLSISVTNIALVLEKYNQIKIYYDTTVDGAFTAELTTVLTRINLLPESTVYEFYDPDGGNGRYYKTAYYHSTTEDEGNKSAAIQGGTEVDKIGYSFGNYSPPATEWGKVITADDMRYTYMWGINCTASDVENTSFEDEQFDYFIEQALFDFETKLTIDIRKRIYKTNVEYNNPTAIRSRLWREGVDYTDIDDAYDYDPHQWQNFGFIQLRHVPVQSVERAILYNQVKGEIMDIKERNWLRLKRDVGQLHIYPTNPANGSDYGPFATGVLPWRMLGGRFPGGFEFDYTTGWPSSDFIPGSLRSAIAKWATIKCLASIGDGLMAGFSSQSVSLDGLSESFSSTQSATSAFFGARIKQYQDELKTWFKDNRYKFGTVPISFVGY